MTDVVERYVAYFEQLQSSELDRLPEVFAPHARFRDPFNDVCGHAAIRAVFEHMFASCGEPRFVVLETAEQGQTAWLRWRFEFSLPVLRKHNIEGASRVRFDAAGLVEEHIDYWDAAELFEALPGLGAPLRWLRGRFSAAGTDCALQKR